MLGERGYLAFPTRVLAGKPPQGFMAWCCSCCRPRPRRGESKDHSQESSTAERDTNALEENKNSGERIDIPATNEPTASESQEVDEFAVNKYESQISEERDLSQARKLESPEEFIADEGDLDKRKQNRCSTETVEIPIMNQPTASESERGQEVTTKKYKSQINEERGSPGTRKLETPQALSASEKGLDVLDKNRRSPETVQIPMINQPTASESEEVTVEMHKSKVNGKKGRSGTNKLETSQELSAVERGLKVLNTNRRSPETVEIPMINQPAISESEEVMVEMHKSKINGKKGRSGTNKLETSQELSAVERGLKVLDKNRRSPETVEIPMTNQPAISDSEEVTVEMHKSQVSGKKGRSETNKLETSQELSAVGRDLEVLKTNNRYPETLKMNKATLEKYVSRSSEVRGRSEAKTLELTQKGQRSASADCRREYDEEKGTSSAKEVDVPQPKQRRVSADERKRSEVADVKRDTSKSEKAVIVASDVIGMEPPLIKMTPAPKDDDSAFDEDDASISEEIPPVVLPTHSKSASPSPIVGAGGRKGPGSVSSGEWPPSPDEDIDRMVAIHLQRSSLSSLGQRSDSLASVYSGARYGTVAVKGEVEFGLEYNYKAGALEIHVKQCRDLAPIDTKRNRSDPYVKVYLLPDKSKSGKRKTKVKKHTLNPVFDETLKFQMTLHGLETRTLWLTVWHSDMFGRNDFLGEVMMGLENKVFDDPSPHWYPLQERTEPFDDLLSYKGDLIIGLKFVPPDVTSAVQKKGKRSSRGSLNVLVKEAKNLTAVKANGTSDPFCKSYLLPDKGRSSKQKTPVLKRTCNPVWNYTFMYEDVSLQELSERSLELTVWDHDRLGSNEFLGGLRFNLGTGKHYGKAVDWMDATGKEVTLWQQMLERPNFWVEGCLTLRPSLEHRNSS